MAAGDTADSRDDAYATDDMTDDLLDDSPALDYAVDEPSPVALVAAGLLGAAIGAGLGLLASRAAAEESRGFADRARRGAAQVRRDASRRAERFERRVRHRGSDAAEGTREALADAVRALGRTREELSDRIDRELRHLRKLASRGRRRGWLR